MHSVFVNILACLYTCLVLLSLLGEIYGQCSLNPGFTRDDKRNGNRRQNLLNKLNSLSKEFRNRPVEAHVNDRTYIIKICPDNEEADDNSALGEKYSRTIRSLGRMNDSDVMISPFGDLLYLVYANGDDYTHACNEAERRSITIIRMTSAVKEPTLFLTKESVYTEEDSCYFVFELYYPLDSEIGTVLKRDSGELLSSATPCSAVSVRAESSTVPSTMASNWVVAQSPTAAAKVAVAAGQTVSAATASAVLSAGSTVTILFNIVLLFMG